MINTYIKENKNRFLDELFNFLRIPSVSTDSNYQHAMHHAADFVCQQLMAVGAQHVNTYKTAGHPIVYGEWMIDEDLPTVLVYGHYDVQPPDPLSLWSSQPFDPVVRNGNIYARGASDDKGQLYMHIKALEIIKNLNLPSCNIKFLIEGEEETGSDHLKTFLQMHQAMLDVDVALISDTALLSMDLPSITVGLRGLVYLEVKVRGPERDAHSGVYGGAVANPVNVLCGMLGSLIDANGRVAIPNFYDNVCTVNAEQKKMINSIPVDDEVYKQTLGVKHLSGEKGYTTLERIGIRPSFDINGIWGGYMREGSKTVLPSEVHAKVSMRLVPNQSSSEISTLVSNYLKAVAPPSVEVNVSIMHGGEPVLTPTNSLAYKSASKAFEDVWGKKPVPTYDGGSIPVVSWLKEIVKTDTILMGFGLHTDAIHAPDEHFGVKNFLMGIQTIVNFHKHYRR